MQTVITDKLLGKGAFGQVFLGIYASKLVAVKVSDNSTLRKEYDMLQKMSPSGRTLIPYNFWHKDHLYHLSTPILGPNIGQLRKAVTFTKSTILRLAPLMLEQIQICHKYGIVHRDVKPDNFVTCYQLDHKFIYLIDFGLADIAGTRDISGTPRFMSPNVHRKEPARELDDYYSLGYTLYYLITGDLPWRGREHEEILAQKESFQPRLNCRHTECGWPDFLIRYFRLLRSIEKGEGKVVNPALFQRIFDVKRHEPATEWCWAELFTACPSPPSVELKASSRPVCQSYMK